MEPSENFLKKAAVGGRKLGMDRQFSIPVLVSELSAPVCTLGKES